MPELNTKQLIEELIKARHADPVREKELAEKLLEKAQDDRDRAYAYSYLADVALQCGRYVTCTEYGAQAVRYFNRCPECVNDHLKAVMHNITGYAYAFLDDVQHSIDNYISAIKISQSTGDNVMMAVVLANIGNMYMTMGGYDKAIEVFEAGFEFLEKSAEHKENVKVNDSVRYYQIMEAYVRKGCPEEARECFEQAEEYLVYKKNTYDEVLRQYNLMMLYDAEGKREEVYNSLVHFMELIRESDDREVHYELPEACRIAVNNGFAEEAGVLIERFGRCIKNIESIRVRIEYSDICVKYAKLTGDEVKLKEAYRDYYRYSSSMAEKINKSERDILNNSVEIKKYREENEYLESRKKELMDSVSKDHLTGIYNRLGFKKYVESENRIFAGSGNIGVIIVDIDYFKEYNDTYGHPAGDGCIKCVADCISQSVDQYGAAARYGGDEFVAYVRGVTYDGLVDVVHDIRRRLAACKLINAESPVSEYVTVSIGAVFEKEEKDRNIADYVHYADKNLYEVKYNNRGGYIVSRI